MNQTHPDDDTPGVTPDKAKPTADDFPDDHPGKQEVVKNPNPRANENLPDSDAAAGMTPEEGEVGSEITDGEAG